MAVKNFPHWFRASCIVILGFTTIVNGLFLQSVQKVVGTTGMPMTTASMSAQQAQLASLAQSGINNTTIGQAWAVIRPVGVPPVYGAAMGISYDDPVAGMNIMLQYDPYQQVDVMNQSVLERYIRIGLMISCEYCCGADTMVFSNGVAACACAHSRAMRGLTRYLIEAYPQMTDREILAELVKWKSLYFPKDASTKAMQLSAQGAYDPLTYLINNAQSL